MVKTKQWDREAKEVEGAQQLIFGAYFIKEGEVQKFKLISQALWWIRVPIKKDLHL